MKFESVFFLLIIYISIILLPLVRADTETSIVCGGDDETRILCTPDDQNLGSAGGICGNGICEGYETYQVCPDDCPFSSSSGSGYYFFNVTGLLIGNQTASPELTIIEFITSNINRLSRIEYLIYILIFIIFIILFKRRKEKKHKQKVEKEEYEKQKFKDKEERFKETKDRHRHEEETFKHNSDAFKCEIEKEKVEKEKFKSNPTKFIHK